MTRTFKYLLLIPAGLLFVGGFFSSCYYDNTEELYGQIVCDTTSVTYSVDIVSILDAACNKCHSTANADVLGGGNILEGFDNLITFVTPNDPLNSTFYESIAWIPGTSFMPKSADKLSSCEIAKVKAWINSGALNN